MQYAERIERDGIKKLCPIYINFLWKFIVLRRQYNFFFVCDLAVFLSMKYNYLGFFFTSGDFFVKHVTSLKNISFNNSMISQTYQDRWIHLCSLFLRAHPHTHSNTNRPLSWDNHRFDKLNKLRSDLNNNQLKMKIISHVLFYLCNF